MSILEQSKTVFKNLLSSISNTLDDASTEETISYGALLWKVSSECKSLLDSQVKPRMRALAREQTQPGTNIKLGGQCKVVLPKKRLVLRKNANIDSVAEALGPAVFAELFTATVTYRVNQDAVNSKLDILTPEAKAILINALEDKEDTPRVSFVEDSSWTK